MSVQIGFFVYKDAHKRWNECTNIAFINNHTCVKVIAEQHERYAREALRGGDNDYFNHYNHLREKG